MSKERIVIVTGGGSGMGKAIAERFANDGSIVYIVGRRIEALNSVAANSKNINVIQGDVTKVEDIKKIVNVIEGGPKRVDVLVNCAGSSGSVEPDMKLEEALKAWHEVIDVNLTSVFMMIQALRPLITKQGGRIINVSSTAALAGSSRIAGVGYASAKAGLHGLMRTLVKEFASQGITINTVAPGATESTDFFGDTIPEERKQSMLAAIPLKKLGQPEDIAAGVYYLASEEAGFITGEILNINGGSQFGR